HWTLAKSSQSKTPALIGAKGFGSTRERRWWGMGQKGSVHTKDHSMTLRAGSLVLASGILLLAGSGANSAASGEGGPHALQWCANAHVIGGSASLSVQQGPPNFAAVARDRTAEQLNVFLSHPHPPMPDLSLTRSEIDDLIAFIGTFR